MNNADIGLAIKERRCFLGIDQKALGELSGVAVHTISNIESGKGNPTIEVVNKIINVLGMELTIRIENES
ncbi:transcriptional regulator [bacterium B17]|nr:transcriptional regulator [bacterium B17]